MDLLSFLFPKYCVGCKKIGDYLCDKCFSMISFNVIEKCLECERPAIDGLTHPICKNKYSIDGVFSILAYKGIVKKLLYVFKYKPYVSSLKKFLVDFMYEGLIQKEVFMSNLNDKLCFVPIPLSKERERNRGYNQSSLISIGIAQKFNGIVLPLIIRVRDQKSQVGLPREERLKNSKGVFKINKDISMPQIIFLVDDVITTGATIIEATKILKKNGAKHVYAIIFASY